MVESQHTRGLLESRPSPYLRQLISQNRDDISNELDRHNKEKCSNGRGDLRSSLQSHFIMKIQKFYLEYKKKKNHSKCPKTVF